MTDQRKIETLDSVEAMRRSHWLYLPQDRPTMDHLISIVVDDVIRCGAAALTLLRCGEFACVQADTDWFENHGGSVSDLFSKLTPTDRINSHRSERIVAVFSDGFYSTGHTGAVNDRLDFEEIPKTLSSQLNKSGRCLIWRSAGFIPRPGAAN